MSNLYRKGFGSWKPSFDESAAPSDSLIRADNVVFDDEGIVASRKGSESEYSTSSAVETEQVTSVVLNSIEHVLSQSGDDIYADGAALVSDMDGSGHISFASANGQLLVTRGEDHKKWDGEMVRNWGIDAPTAAPDVEEDPLAFRTIASCSQAAGEFTATEGTLSYITGYDGVANAANAVTPAVGTGRGILSYTFPSSTDLLNFLGAEGGDFDLFSFWVNDSQPQDFEFLTIVFGLSPGSDPFLTDSYIYQFGSELPALAPTPEEIQRSMDTTPPAEVPPPPEGPPATPEETPERPRREPPERRPREA